jgi:hypothetical protein
MSRLCLYYKGLPASDRWFPGDQHIRSFVRRLVRGRPRPSGVDKVFLNLCLGLDKLGVHYEINLPFRQLRDDDRVGVLGSGRHCLEGYDRSNPIMAGVALMTHPSEWPTLCDEYPVKKYLQHSEWASNIYQPYFGDRCAIWPVGINTESWSPSEDTPKTNDFLIYDKIRWNHDRFADELISPILDELRCRGHSFETIRYGHYDPAHFRAMLSRSKAMIFLCEHESQGIAYQECLASGVPILAWDQGWCLDPNRFRWGQSEIPATSVPYFDERCGVKFVNVGEFSDALKQFWQKLTADEFRPRSYIVENLSLEMSAQRYIQLLETIA